MVAKTELKSIFNAWIEHLHVAPTPHKQRPLYTFECPPFGTAMFLNSLQALD